jgi:hypothetical protein
MSSKLRHPAPWILFVAFYAIFANVPFWIGSFWLGIWCHGWFCVEFVVVGLLALYLPCYIAAALLLLVIVADFVSGISETYYLSPSECLRSFIFLPEFSGNRLFAITVVAALASIVVAIAFILPKLRGTKRTRAAACFLGFAVAMLFTDYTTLVRGIGHLLNPLRSTTLVDGVKPIYFRGLRLARPVTVRLVRNEIFFDHIRDQARIQQAVVAPAPSASAVAVQSSGLATEKINQTRPNLVLVLLESWGLDSNPAVRDLLVKDYFQPDILAHYQVLQGTVPFYGSTIAGEARELCSSKIDMHILNASASELQDCLPERLSALGYHNLAVHGMDSHMFNRRDWYPRIGFQELWFRDRFRQLGLPECIGAYTATCDATLADWIKQRLDQQNPAANPAADSAPDFVYWITINSHLPVPIPPPVLDPAPCSLAAALSTEPALCAWYQLVSNVHRSVAHIAMSNLARPTVFVLVGDHAPPFVDPVLRSQFSHAVVPYIVLVPRATTLPIK